MEDRTYEVTLHVQAKDQEELDFLLDRMYAGLSDHDYRKIGDPETKDLDESRFQERIRYVEDWNGHGEHFIFEGKHTDEDEWGLDTAFKLFDLDNKDAHEKGALVHYTALTKIRELMKNETEFWWFSNVRDY